MASLIDDIRKLHGPEVVAHSDGFDVEVVCPECSRTRLEALNEATSGGEDWFFGNVHRASYPCATRIAAGITAEEGEKEARDLRLERLTAMHQDALEKAERIGAIIALVSAQDEDPQDEPEEKPAPKRAARKVKSAPEKPAEEPAEDPAPEPDEVPPPDGEDDAPTPDDIDLDDDNDF